MFFNRTLKSNTESVMIGHDDSESVKDASNIDFEIHNSVYSSEKNILDQALFIMSQPDKYDEGKGKVLEKLKDIGFGNAEEVKDHTYQKKIKDESNIKYDRIKYYNIQYPLNRFIDEDSVKLICKKYNLILSSVNNYISEIPYKNQLEIVNFKVKSGDCRFPTEVLDTIIAIMDTNWTRINDDKFISGKFLLIIAPEHKLNVSKGEIEDNVLKIKDPIVLQPVKEGYLIVSSWGLEASDELIVNKINN